MGLFDDLRPKLEAGPEFWIDRIRGEIGFTSPDGTEFTAKWIGDSRSKSKRLQMTDYLETKYTKVRDLEIASTTHPITFFFDGNDCDKTAEKFWRACDEKGQWEVIHPVNGFRSYQLVSVTQKNQYVESGGVVEYNTEWIEPQNDEVVESGRQLKSMADFHRAVLKENAALSFAEKLAIGSEALRKHMENISNKVAGIADKTLGPVAALNDFVYEAFLSASSLVKNIKLSTKYQALSLAGQIQNLIEIAVNATTDPFKRNRAYNDMVDSTIGDGFTTVGGKTEVSVGRDAFGVNKALMIELASLSSTSSLCEIATTSVIDTVDDGISIIDNLVENLENITAQIDTIQNDLSSNTTIDKGFIGAESTINDLSNAIASSIQYVLYVISKSNVRKTIIIDQNVTTLKFYINHYRKSTGFFEFCDRNNLTANEFFMLPVGREIQV